MGVEGVPRGSGVRTETAPQRRRAFQDEVEEGMRTVELKNGRRTRAWYVDAEDGTLAGLAAGGDDDAFTGLVVRHSGLVRAVAFGIVGSQDAQDACQEVWVRVWWAIGGFRGESSFTSWLYRIAFNTCLSARKKDERRRFKEVTAFDAGSTLVTSEDDPEAMFLAGEQARKARGILLKVLPQVRKEHRAALVLRHVENLSYAEVAEVLGVPQGTAKGWVYRGRATLLAAMSPSLPEPEPTSRSSADEVPRGTVD